MSTPTNEFDAIAKALESGDLESLDKLMKSEEEIQYTEPEADPTESAEPELPGDDATKTETVEVESEDSPSNEEVANGETTDPVAEEPSTPEAAPPAASTATPVIDETEELKKELQRYKSDAGRVPFIQRRMAELERELRAYKARDTQTTQSAPKVTTDGVELDEETKRQIDELREVDPVMAKTMERVAKAAIAGSKAQVDHVFTTYTKAEQDDDDQRFLIEQQAELVRDVPNAYQIFAHPAWAQWKQTLTPGQRAMAESAYAADVKQAIYAFAAVMQQQEAQPQQAAQPQAQQPAQVVQAVVAAPVATPASTEESDKIKEARARKVATSAEAKPTSAKAAVEFDQDAYFREMYEKIGKENHILKS